MVANVEVLVAGERRGDQRQDRFDDPVMRSWAATTRSQSGSQSRISTRTPVERVRGSASARHMTPSQSDMSVDAPHGVVMEPLVLATQVTSFIAPAEPGQSSSVWT
jgi:hypothetical protein